MKKLILAGWCLSLVFIIGCNDKGQEPDEPLLRKLIEEDEVSKQVHEFLYQNDILDRKTYTQLFNEDDTAFFYVDSVTFNNDLSLDTRTFHLIAYFSNGPVETFHNSVRFVYENNRVVNTINQLTENENAWNWIDDHHLIIGRDTLEFNEDYNLINRFNDNSGNGVIDKRYTHYFYENSPTSYLYYSFSPSFELTGTYSIPSRIERYTEYRNLATGNSEIRSVITVREFEYDTDGKVLQYVNYMKEEEFLDGVLSEFSRGEYEGSTVTFEYF